MAFRLGWARNRAGRLLTDQATLIRVTLTDDGAGGRLRTETSLGSYAFRLHSQSALTGAGNGREDISGDRIRAEGEWIGFLPAETVVQESDIVLHGSNRYEVIQETGDRTEHAVVSLVLRRVD